MVKLKISSLELDGVRLIAKGTYQSEEHFNHMDIVTIDSFPDSMHVDNIEEHDDGSTVLTLSSSTNDDEGAQKVLIYLMDQAPDGVMYKILSVDSVGKNQ